MPEITKVVTRCGLPSGEEADWSYWISANTTPSGQNFVNAVCSALAADATWKALFPAAVTFGSPKISLVDQATGEIISTSISGASYAATGIGSALPPQCSTVVTLRTPFASRSDTGRFYLPGPNSTNTTAVGRLLPAAASSIAARLVAAFEAGNAAALGVTLIVYSRTHRSTTEVNAIDVGDVVDTQRRRRDKLVENRVVDPITWI